MNNTTQHVVVAPNVHRANDFIRQRGLNPHNTATVVADATPLKGLSKASIFLLKGWEDLPYAPDVEKAVGFAVAGGCTVERVPA